VTSQCSIAQEHHKYYTKILKLLSGFMQFRITHPMARMNCAIAWFALLLVCHELSLVALITAIAIFGAVVAGWKQGGGPPWWMLLITVSVTIIAFCIHLYPKFLWDSSGWIHGVPVALRLTGFISIGVWTVAGIPVARLAKALENIFAATPLLRNNSRNRSFTLAVTIAIASWGWLRQETDRVKTALIARNVRFNDSLLNRIRTTQSMLFIIIASALRRADGLSVALYCRGWRENSPRTSERPIPFNEKFAMILSWTCVVFAGADRWIR